MFNPVLEAFNAWLAIYDKLPFAVTSLISLSLLLFLIPVIVSHFNTIR